jgi:threonine/homoserine/homoserine lactone efflux protein
MIRLREMIGSAMPIDGAQLAGFIVVAALLVVTPGPNTLLILTNSVAGGRSAGLATVLGVETGTLVHTIASAVGISVVLANSAAAFDAMKYVGSAYLAFLGLRAFMSGGHSLPDLRETSMKPARTFRQALLTSILNPKAAMFFLALLPQFVRRDHGHVASQFIVLGATVAVIGFAFGCLLTVAASRAHAWLRHDVVARWRERLTGSVLIGLSVRLALTQRS